MVRREVSHATERRGQDQYPARPQEPRKLPDRQQGIGDVFQNLGAEDGVEGSIRFGDAGDVTDDVEPPVIPSRHLKPGGSLRWIVLREVLRDVLQVRTKLAVLLLTRSRVE